MNFRYEGETMERVVASRCACDVHTLIPMLSHRHLTHSLNDQVCFFLSPEHRYVVRSPRIGPTVDETGKPRKHLMLRQLRRNTLQVIQQHARAERSAMIPISLFPRLHLVTRTLAKQV